MRDRQTNPAAIREDHLQRYRYATTLAKGPVLDAACGIGYGAYAIARMGHEVTAVDIEPDAISAALRHFDDEKVVRWIRGDILRKPWDPQKFRTIVSFETLEHLRSPDLALKHFHDSLLPGGQLICSVPNEAAYPFEAEKFKGDQYPHLRHYTPIQFEALLNDGGFDVMAKCHQIGKQSPVSAGTHGMFLVYTCAPK